MTSPRLRMDNQYTVRMEDLLQADPSLNTPSAPPTSKLSSKAFLLSSSRPSSFRAAIQKTFSFRLGTKTSNSDRGSDNSTTDANNTNDRMPVKPLFYTNTLKQAHDRDSDLSSSLSVSRMSSLMRGDSQRSDLRSLTSHGLNSVLQDSLLKDRFREHCNSLSMTENLDCVDEINRFHNTANKEERLRLAWGIMEQFVLDSAALQVNLSGRVRDKLTQAYEDRNEEELSHVDFFREMHLELFKDIKQSDAFRCFLEQDVGSITTINKGI